MKSNSPKPIHIKDNFYFHQSIQSIKHEDQLLLNKRLEHIAECRCKNYLEKQELLKQQKLSYKILTKIEKILSKLSIF